MIRFIGKTIDSVQPHGEALVTYQTFTDLSELESWLSETWKFRMLIGAELVSNRQPAEPKTKTDDDIPF